MPRNAANAEVVDKGCPSDTDNYFTKLYGTSITCQNVDELQFDKLTGVQRVVKGYKTIVYDI